MGFSIGHSYYHNNYHLTPSLKGPKFFYDPLTEPPLTSSPLPLPRKSTLTPSSVSSTLSLAFRIICNNIQAGTQQEPPTHPTQDAQRLSHSRLPFSPVTSKCLSGTGRNPPPPQCRWGKGKSKKDRKKKEGYWRVCFTVLRERR